jgi:hypothetical protein
MDGVIEMLKVLKTRLVPALIVFSGVLAGCQTVGAGSPNIVWGGTNDALVLFNAGEFKDTSSRHVIFTDMWQHEEYALFQGQGAQAEIIYAAADERDTIVIEYTMPVQKMVGTWKFPNIHPATWGAKGGIEGPLGTYFYQRFQLGVTGRNCFGFFTEWDQRQDDPGLRDSKVLFGYYCAPPGATLSDARMFDLIDSVSIRGISSRFNTRFTPVSPKGAKVAGAVAFARGGSGNTGNANYPFDMAVHFQDADGDSDERQN